MKKVTWSTIYYTRSVDPIVSLHLNAITTEKTKSTEKMQAAAAQLFDYLVKLPDATIRYHKSDMILQIHSDPSDLSIYYARSRLGGLFYCVDKPPNAVKINCYILNSAALIKNVVASAA
jgi:hypothetical protein